jgi:hypothetical protein
MGWVDKPDDPNKHRNATENARAATRRMFEEYKKRTEKK